MSRLIARDVQRMGTVTKIEEQFQDDPEQLRDAYVQACMIVIDNYTATKLIRAGFANGWRFMVKEEGFVELWAPAVLYPVKYIIHNATLARAVSARGSGLITGEE